MSPFLSKGPYKRNDDGGHDPDADGQRQTELQVILENIPARTVDKKVGLIADRRRVAGRSPETQADNKRPRIHIKSGRRGQGNGHKQNRGRIIAQEKTQQARQQNERAQNHIGTHSCKRR